MTGYCAGCKINCSLRHGKFCTLFCAWTNVYPWYKEHIKMVEKRARQPLLNELEELKGKENARS